jgi:transcriptional regulator GlxA family with amidase domain
LQPEQALLDYLLAIHAKGSVICSVCAGAFILAQSGLLRGRTITTHWQLEQQLAHYHPDLNIDINKIVIDDVDIITAGGLMSWMDLCFALVTRYANARDTRQLGKYLVVDTGVRDQRYYQSFSPGYSHGDDKIALVQRHIQASYGAPLDIDTLATLACMTSRTFIRHFSKATGLTPIHYIQRVRIQKACEWLESSAKSVESISYLVGYEDVNSFRKVFVKAIGLTPSAFRSRFVATQNEA